MVFGSRGHNWWKYTEIFRKDFTKKSLFRKHLLQINWDFWHKFIRQTQNTYVKHYSKPVQHSSHNDGSEYKKKIIQIKQDIYFIVNLSDNSESPETGEKLWWSTKWYKKKQRRKKHASFGVLSYSYWRIIAMKNFLHYRLPLFSWHFYKND